MYPFLSERAARIFAMHAISLRDLNQPRDRRLAERYRRASLYLSTRIGR